MPWPLSQDYNEAIQNPSFCFHDPELKEGQAATNPLGLPVPRSGNFADVYEVACPKTQTKWAVKCFTREVPGLRERYSEISAHLRQAKLPFTVDFQYLADGIRVQGKWYPVLKMQWVEGLLLNEFVRAALDKPALLDSLCQIWVRMGRRLREAEVAHADLQHGNVILVPGSKAASLAVKLIDYDGMVVPALAQKKSGEAGHPAYQHPQRLREGTYNPQVDRFPLLLVATALQCLKAGGPALWQRYDNGDNLLFREADVRAPGESGLFKELWQLRDPVAHALVGTLTLAALNRLEQAPLADELLEEGTTPALSGAQEKQVTALLGGAPPIRHAASVPVARPAEFDFGTANASVYAPPSPKRRGQPVWLWAAGAAALLGLAAGAAFIMTRNGRPEESAQVPVAKKSGGPSATERTEEKKGPEPSLPASPPESQPRVSAPPETKPEAVPASRRPKNPPRQKPPTTTPPSAVSPKAVASPAKPPPKLPVPKEAVLAAVREEIKRDYQDDYAKQAPAEKKVFAARLLADGIAAKDQPDRQFALLREARDLSARLLELTTAYQAAEETAKWFAVNVLEERAAALEVAAEAVATQAATNTVADYVRVAVEEARVADEYDIALRVLRVVRTIAVNMRSPGLVTSFQGLQSQIDALRQEYAKIDWAPKALADDPQDRDANLALGKFYGVYKGDWTKGLPLLARGGDAKLCELARQDLATPNPGPPLVELAGGYEVLAEAEKGTARTNLLRRAYYWYLQAEDKATGSEQELVARRLAELEKQFPGHAFTILYARLGADNAWADVTGRVRSLHQAKGPKLTLKPADLGIGDPAPNKVKSLVVVYTHREKTFLSLSGQEDTVTIPSASAKPVTEAARTAGSHALPILAAYYGADNSWADVTDKVHSLAEDGKQAIKPANLEVRDPAFGKRKALVILFRYAGRILLSTSGQGDVVLLQAPR